MVLLVVRSCVPTLGLQNASLPSELGCDPVVLTTSMFKKLGMLLLLMLLSSSSTMQGRAGRQRRNFLHNGYVPMRTTSAETPNMTAKELASLSSSGGGRASGVAVGFAAAELEPFESRVTSELKGLACSECWEGAPMIAEASTRATCSALGSGIWGTGKSVMRTL